MERLIFHVDVNSAFLSWEATKRVKEGLPDLRLIPSAVGGDPEDRRSVILAKSVPAKKYGVTTGEPVTLALRKCPELVLVRSDFMLYRKCSKAFKDICREYAPVVEEFSIDECFLDMTGTSLIYPDPIKTAYEIKDRIKNELGFTVNIGIGPNKMLAKTAGDFEKPDKVHTLFLDELEKKLWPKPCGDLLLCGKSSVEHLAKYQIRTIGQLAKTDPKIIEQILGNKLGRLLHEYALGIDDSPVSDAYELPKSISNEITFREDVTTREEAYRVLLYLSDKVGTRTRREGAKASCISVTIRGNDMKKHSHQKNLWSPTDVTSEFYETAKELFDSLWDGKLPMRLMGVALSNLDWDGFEQVSLFDEEEERHKKEAKADKALDDLKAKFGDKVWRGDTKGLQRRK